MIVSPRKSSFCQFFWKMHRPIWSNSINNPGIYATVSKKDFLPFDCIFSYSAGKEKTERKKKKAVKQ